MDYPATGEEQGFALLFPWTPFGKALPEAKALLRSMGSLGQVRHWGDPIPAQPLLLETPNSLRNPRNPREPELIPPVHLGAPSPTASSPSQLWDISSGSGILLLSIFLDNCTAEAPQVLQTNESFFWAGTVLILVLVLIFFSAKKLQKTQFLSSQPPNIFAVFPASCAREPQPC